MASPEYNAESVVIALIQAHASFSGVTVVHQCEDTASVSVVNRLTVKCEPSTTLLTARRPFLAPRVSEATITVTAKTNGTETVFDEWRDALDEALASAPAEVVTTATSLFPNGFGIRPPNTGDIEQDDQRALNRSYPVFWQP